MEDVVKRAPGVAQPKLNLRHRFYHVPASNTAVGHMILENPGH
jgi:protocatechuate 4,5-dioxygenase beta chain